MIHRQNSIDKHVPFHRSPDNWGLFFASSGEELPLRYLAQDSLVHLLVLLVSFGRSFFLQGSCRLFLGTFLFVLTFAHDDLPLRLDCLRSVLFEPLEHLTNTARGQCDTRVRRPVVDVNGISVVANCVPTWKNDVSDISFLFVGFFRSKDPFTAAPQANLGLVQIKQCQS